MSCVTPHLYNRVAMYQYQQQQLQPHPHLLARPLLLCHRLPAMVGQYDAVQSRPGDLYPRVAEPQIARNHIKPLTPFSIADILRDGHSRSSSPPPVVPARQVRSSVDTGRRRSPDSTLRPRRPGSRRADDVRPRSPSTSGGGAISRPWDDGERPRRHSTDPDDDHDCDDVIDDDEDIEVDDVEMTQQMTSDHDTASHPVTSVCPLDALLRMTSQPFDDPSSPGLNNFLSLSL